MWSAENNGIYSVCSGDRLAMQVGMKKFHTRGYPPKPTPIWRVFPSLIGFWVSSISKTDTGRVTCIYVSIPNPYPTCPKYRKLLYTSILLCLYKNRNTNLKHFTHAFRVKSSIFSFFIIIISLSLSDQSIFS